MNKNQIKTGDLTRHFELDRSAINEEARTVALSFSSESPVERWFGMEVLDHSPESVDLGRLESGAPLLMDHNTSDQIGIVESATVADGKGRAVVRFSKSTRGQEIFADVMDGIRQNISVGYRIHEMTLEDSRGNNDDVETYRATNWQPYEVSVVSTPADINVGIGRSAEGDNLTTIQNLKEEIKMSEDKTINVEEVRSEARDMERTRVAGISAIADQHPQLKEIARQFIESGKPLDTFRQIALEKITAAAPKAPEARVDDVDLSAKEQRQYSLLRALKAHSIGDWSGAGLEREVSLDIEKRIGSSNGGFFIPANMQWNSRANTAGTHTSIVATDHYGDSFIDALRANLVVDAAGATFMSNLQGNVAIPALDSTTNVHWVAENGTPTAGAPTFRQVTLSPHTVAGYVDISRTLMNQSDPSVEQVLRNDLSSGIAAAIDSAALQGDSATDSSVPNGILNTSGISSVDLTDGAPTFAQMVAMETSIAAANASGGSMSYITTPAMLGAMKTTQKDAGSGLFVADGNTVNGYEVRTTSQLAAGTAIFGNFSDLILGQFGAVEVVTERSATSGALTVGIFTDVDIAVKHAQSFCKGA